MTHSCATGLSSDVRCFWAQPADRRGQARLAGLGPHQSADGVADRVIDRDPVEIRQMEPVVARALAFAFEVEGKGLAIGDVPAEAFTIHPREPYMTRFDRRRRAEAHRVFHRHPREYGQKKE